MSFLDYIRGQRKGKEANLIERASMTDPFLLDAIDGFDSVKDNHAQKIEELSKRFQKQRKTVSRPVLGYMTRIAAVAVVVLFVLGGYLFFDSHKTSLYAQQQTNMNTIEIFVPEVFYEENEAIIEEKNEVLSEKYKPNIENFRVNEILNMTISKEEFEALNKELMRDDYQTTLEIYFPDDDEVIHSTTGKPEPKIGWSKYKSYLKDEMIRPTDFSCGDVHGKVGLDFYINEKGEPYNIEVAYSLCGTLDNEAVRLVKEGPNWTVGSEKVRVVIEF